MKNNASLKDLAKKSLKGKWGIAIGGCLIYNLVMMSVNSIPFLGPLALLAITGPLSLGLAWFSLDLAKNNEAKIEIIFDGFKEFSKAALTYILMIIYIIGWALIFIIPGIIKAISYSQTFYILSDDPSIGSEEAIQKSMSMMDGHKLQYLLLGLSFFGWAILCLFTLGIGFLWLIPYIQVSYAKFYLNLKEENNLELDQGGI
jgi:uncharacterized membrane protein